MSSAFRTITSPFAKFEHQLRSTFFGGKVSYEISAEGSRTSAQTTYQVVADNVGVNASTGNQLRVHHLALLGDPAYATYFGGSANVTAAKVTLINRVTPIYEDETSIRRMLIGNNNLLNLDTAAQFSGVSGPCGGTACYAAASVSCSGATPTRTRTVIGLLVGASNFDIGHIGVGAGGAGIASLGVVGGNSKAQGCTGLPTPVGDLFAVNYVAHEMGHQFAGHHTFNGVAGNRAGANGSAANSVEPGSGTSVMADAGLCGTDDTQPHSDPYWSQQSFDEITTCTSAAETLISEVQHGVLTHFTTGGQQFALRVAGVNSAPILRCTNFTAAGIKAVIEGITSWPAGGTVTVSTVGDTSFLIMFGGTLANTNIATLQLVNCTGCSGFVGAIAAGGITDHRARRQHHHAAGQCGACGDNGGAVHHPVAHPVRTDRQRDRCQRDRYNHQDVGADQPWRRHRHRSHQQRQGQRPVV